MNKRDIQAIAATILVSIPVLYWTAGMGGIALFISLSLMVLARPLFSLYALALPNARSSHRAPVPQGGGAPIILATVIATILSISMSDMTFYVAIILIASVLLGIVGFFDDIKGLTPQVRFLLQCFAVALVMVFAPSSWRILDDVIPVVYERALLIIAGVWFVNLTNFMDGIDGITLAGLMPLAAGAYLMGDISAISAHGKILAACFLAAQVAFIFFNWHPARLFLGDVGSLPMGLIGGALLFDMATHGAVAAAIILPIYHFLDATSTLLLRLRRGERVWEAHRQHAYQRAVDGGLSHHGVSGLVLLLNAVMVTLAIVSVGQSLMVQVTCVIIALALACGLIIVFRCRVKPDTAGLA